MKLKQEYESNILKLNDIVEKQKLHNKTLDKEILSLEALKNKLEKDLEQ